MIIYKANLVEKGIICQTLYDNLLECFGNGWEYYHGNNVFAILQRDNDGTGKVFNFIKENAHLVPDGISFHILIEGSIHSSVKISCDYIYNLKISDKLKYIEESL